MRQTTGTKIGIAAAILAWLGVSSPAGANVIFTLGNHPQPHEQNILLGGFQTGTTITGATKRSQIEVQFTSTESLSTGGIGQAFFKATTGLLTNFSFTVPGQTFDDFIFDPQIGGKPKGGGGIAVITAVANDGSFTDDLILHKGKNFLTITTSGDETLSLVSLRVDGAGFNNLKQPRVSGISATVPVPEPTRLVLLGGSLLGIGLVRLRRKIYSCRSIYGLLAR